MANVGKMFWYSKLECWYCKIDGRKQWLSPDEKDATQLYIQHLAKHGRGIVPKGLAKGRRKARMILVPTCIRKGVEARVADGGIVFRTTRGTAWTKNSINCSFRRLKVRLADEKLCATSARHSFAVAKIESGVAIELVAQLMGHTSTRMVYQRYGHYLKTNVLSAAAEAGF